MHALRRSWLDTVKQKVVKMGVVDCVSKIPCSSVCEKGLVKIKQGMKVKTGITWSQFEAIHNF